MRSLRQAIEFAGIFVVLAHGSIAADLLPPDRPIAEVVDHYIDATLARERVKPAPRADDATLVRRLTLDLAGRIPTAAEARAFVGIHRSREDGPARRSPDGVAGLRPAPGGRARRDAHGRRTREPARLPGAGRRREPAVGPDLPRADAARPGRARPGRRPPSTSSRGSRTPTGSPPRSAPRSSASTSVAPSATTTRWWTTGSRTTSTA